MPVRTNIILLYDRSHKDHARVEALLRIDYWAVNTGICSFFVGMLLVGVSYIRCGIIFEINPPEKQLPTLKTTFKFIYPYSTAYYFSPRWDAITRT